MNIPKKPAAAVVFLTAAVFLLQSCASVTWGPNRAIPEPPARLADAVQAGDDDAGIAHPADEAGKSEPVTRTQIAYDPGEPLITRVTGLRLDQAVGRPGALQPLFTAQGVPGGWPPDRTVSFQNYLKALIVITVLGIIAFFLFIHKLSKDCRGS